jgi:hypothetical protein
MHNVVVRRFLRRLCGCVPRGRCVDGELDSRPVSGRPARLAAPTYSDAATIASNQGDPPALPGWQ